jgi:hypothetical protein
MPDKGKQLDLISSAESAQPKQAKNSFLGVQFACCDTYARVYANRDKTAYVGHCPRCAKRVQFQIGPGGSEARFFKAF